MDIQLMNIRQRHFTIKWIRHKNGKISYQLIYDGQKEDLEEENKRIV